MATSYKRTVDIAVKVTGDTKTAINNIAENLKALDKVVKGLQVSATTAVTNINNISKALEAAKTFKAPDLDKFGTDIKAIGKVDPQKISDLATALKSLKGVTAPAGFDKLVDALIKLGSASKPPDYTKFVDNISKLGAIGKFPSLVSFVNQVTRLNELGTPPDISKFAKGLAELGKVKDLPKIPTELVQNIQALAGLKNAPNLSKFAEGLAVLKKVRITDSQIGFLTKLAPALKGLSDVKSGPNLTTFAKGLKEFSEVKVKSGQVNTIAQLAPALRAFNGLQIPSIDKFIASLENLGKVRIPSLKKITEEINTLASAFAKLTSASPLITTLNRIGQSSAQVSGQIDQMTRSTRRADTAFGAFGERVKSYFSYRLIADSVIALKEYFTEAFTAITEYSQGLKDLQAITLSTDSAVADMAITIQRVAGTTKFSTTEVAEGMKLLAQAGLETEEAIGGMEAVSNLATGTLSTMANTVDLMTTAYRVFDLEISDFGRLSDVFANAVNRSKLTIEKLRTAMNYVGPVAASVGVSVEETSAAMMTLANSGLRASTIGTGLRRVLSELASPSIKLARAAKRAGVDLRALDPTAHTLSDVFSTLGLVITDAGTAFDIFGKRGAASALAITNNVEDSFDDTVDTVSKFGTAAEMAEIQMEGLGVSFKNLKDKMSLVAVSMGEAGLIDILKFLIDTSRDVADALADIVRRPGTAFVAWASLAALAVTGIVRGGSKLIAFLTAKKAALVGVTASQNANTLAEQAGNLAKQNTITLNAAAMKAAMAEASAKNALTAAIARESAAQASVATLKAADVVDTTALTIAEAELAAAKTAVTRATVAHTAASQACTAAEIAQAGATKNLTIANAELAASQVAVSRTSRLMFLTNPIFLFIAAVTAAITVIYFWTDSLKNSIRTFRKLNEEIDTTKESLKGYISELEGMASLPDTEEERLALLEKLANKYPVIAAEIYKTGDSVEGLLATLNKYNAKLDVDKQENLVNGMYSFGEAARKARDEINDFQEQISGSSDDIEGSLALEEMDPNEAALGLGKRLGKEAEQVRLVVASIVASGQEIGDIDWAKLFKVDASEVDASYADLKEKVTEQVLSVREAAENASIATGKAFFGIAGKWKRDIAKNKEVVDDFISGVIAEGGKVDDILAKADKERAIAFTEARQKLLDEMSDAQAIYDGLEKPTTAQTKALFATSEDIAKRSAELMKEYSGQMGSYYISEAASLKKWYNEKKATLGKLSDNIVGHYKLEQEFLDRKQRILVGMANEKLSYETMVLENKEIESAYKEHLLQLKTLKAEHGISGDEYDAEKMEATKSFYRGMADRATKFYNDLETLRDKDPVIFKKAQELMLSMTEKFETAKTELVEMESKKRLEFINLEATRATSSMEKAYSTRLRKIAIAEAKGTITHEEAEKQKLSATLQRYAEEERIAKDTFESIRDEGYTAGDDEFKEALEEMDKVSADATEKRAKSMDEYTESMAKTTTKLKDNLDKRNKEEGQYTRKKLDIEAKLAQDSEQLAIDNTQKVAAIHEALNTTLTKLDEKRVRAKERLIEKLSEIENSADANIQTSRDDLGDKLASIQQKRMSQGAKEADNLRRARAKIASAEEAFDLAKATRDEEARKRAEKLLDQAATLYEGVGDESTMIAGLRAVQKAQEEVILLEGDLKKDAAKKEWSEKEKQFTQDLDRANKVFKDAIEKQKIDNAQRVTNIKTRHERALELENVRHLEALRNIDKETARYLNKYILEKQLRDQIASGVSGTDAESFVRSNTSEEDGGVSKEASEATDKVNELADAKDKANQDDLKLKVDQSQLDVVLSLLDTLSGKLDDEFIVGLKVKLQNGDAISDAIMQELKEVDDTVAKKVADTYTDKEDRLDTEKGKAEVGLTTATSKTTEAKKTLNEFKQPLFPDDRSANAEEDNFGNDQEFERKKSNFTRFVTEFTSIAGKLRDDATNMFADKVSDGFTDWITGAKDFKTAMGDMARSFVADISRMIVKAMLFKAIQSAIGIWGFSGGGKVGPAHVGAGGTTAFGMASGGPVHGPGTGTSDSIPAWLSNGEYVMTAKETANWLPVLETMRQGKFGQWLESLGGYAKGGLVAHVPKTPHFASGGLVAGQKGTGDPNGTNVNVTVNYSSQAGSSSQDNEEITATSTHIKKFGRILSDMVSKEIVEQQRPGGLLFNG